jgi:hypothetical protein
MAPLKVCSRPEDPAYHWLEARGFDFAKPRDDDYLAINDDARLDSLAVRVTPAANGTDKLATKSNGMLSVEVMRDGVLVCQVDRTGYTTSRQRWEVDLYGSAACTNALPRAGSLDGLLVRVGIRPETGAKCTSWGLFQYMCTPEIRDINFGLEMPKIDSIQLVATSTSADDHMAAQVTVNETAGIGTGVHIDGEVFLPSISLDVMWDGPASAEPLVHGPLVLNALGSEVDAGAEAGIICCSPLSDEVVLTASVDGVDGTVLGVARARIEDAKKPLASTVVMSWDLCSRAGCPEIDPG